MPNFSLRIGLPSRAQSARSTRWPHWRTGCPLGSQRTRFGIHANFCRPFRRPSFEASSTWWRSVVRQRSIHRPVRRMQIPFLAMAASSPAHLLRKRWRRVPHQRIQCLLSGPGHRGSEAGASFPSNARNKVRKRALRDHPNPTAGKNFRQRPNPIKSPQRPLATMPSLRCQRGRRSSPRQTGRCGLRDADEWTARVRPSE